MPLDKSEEVSKFDSKLDIGKWLLIILLLTGAIVANIYFAQLPTAIRAAGGIVVFVAILAIGAVTEKGKQARLFIKSARSELRKVVWPTRQETVQTTLVVVAIVVLMAIILWGLDSVFMWLIGVLTSQGG